MDPKDFSSPATTHQALWVLIPCIRRKAMAKATQNLMTSQQVTSVHTENHNLLPTCIYFLLSFPLSLLLQSFSLLPTGAFFKGKLFVRTPATHEGLSWWYNQGDLLQDLEESFAAVQDGGGPAVKLHIWGKHSSALVDPQFEGQDPLTQPMTSPLSVLPEVTVPEQQCQLKEVWHCAEREASNRLCCMLVGGRLGPGTQNAPHSHAAL